MTKNHSIVFGSRGAGFARATTPKYPKSVIPNTAKRSEESYLKDIPLPLNPNFTLMNREAPTNPVKRKNNFMSKKRLAFSFFILHSSFFILHSKRPSV
jgi:hypothetical protein